MTAAGVAHVLERNLFVYRRIWRGSVFFTFVSPLLFLTAMGLGLGGYVDRTGSAALGGLSYLAFLAPGLLAAQAMQIGTFESTFQVLSQITHVRNYQAMLATPLHVHDLVAGHLLWIVFRVIVAATAFFTVMAIFGAVVSPLGVLAIGVSILTGLAFAAPVTAFTATLRTDELFSVLFRFIVTPLFLFSGTFFPIDRLPELLRPVAYLTPTYHGVALARGLSLGTVDVLAAALHVGVLLAYIVVGVAAASVTFRRRLAE